MSTLHLVGQDMKIIFLCQEMKLHSQYPCIHLVERGHLFFHEADTDQMDVIKNLQPLKVIAV